MSEELKGILQKDDKYGSFIILDKPIKFSELFKNRDIQYIQLYKMITSEQELNQNITEVIFVGIFQWINNEVYSLDKGSYSKDMIVVGYSWYKDDVRRFLEILIKSD